MGGGLQTGDGRQLSLRFRLLLATIAIVAVSLTLAGAVTWTLVSRLEFSRTQDQLAKNALLLRQPIGQLDCAEYAISPTTHLPTTSCARRVASESAFLDNFGRQVATLDPVGERLILLDKPLPIAGARRTPAVLYDSAGELAMGTPVPLGRETTVIGQSANEGDVELQGQRYVLAAARLGNRFASWVVLAIPDDEVTAQATATLLRPIVLSGIAGLGLAIVVTLVLSRAFTRPLRELRRAAEDIAGGNYARRIQRTGNDEIGVVGQSFNRMAEAVERARHQQRTFLANVSHELKTPLTSLIGFSQALMDGSLRTPEEKERAATILHEEAQRVLRMSQELLDLARVESGQLTLNAHPVDLGVQLQQEIELVRQRADQRRLVMRLDVPAALPPVRADPDRLHQILDNLLDNAVKYAPEGTTVWISAEYGSGFRITTTVRNRVGVRPPDPARMFDRFYRGDPSRSSAGGVGLGLAISRELAIAQDGDLRAELGADGSLSLKLDLPVAAQPPQSLEAPSRAPVRLAPRPQLRA